MMMEEAGLFPEHLEIFPHLFPFTFTSPNSTFSLCPPPPSLACLEPLEDPTDCLSWTTLGGQQRPGIDFPASLGGGGAGAGA